MISGLWPSITFLLFESRIELTVDNPGKRGHSLSGKPCSLIR